MIAQSESIGEILRNLLKLESTIIHENIHPFGSQVDLERI